MSDAAEVADIGADLPSSSGNPDPVADLAQKMGWNPDFEGANALTAEQFIMNANEVARTASKAARDRADRLEKLEKQLEQQGKRTEKLMSEFREQATARLKREMKEAVDAGDHARAAEIMDESRQAVANEAPPPEPAGQGGVPQEHAAAVQSWVQSNAWYGTDTVVQSVADAVFNSAYRPDMSSGEVQDLLGSIESQVRRELPHKFAGTPKTDVNDDSRPASRKKSESKLWDKLSAGEKDIAEQFIEDGFGADAKTLTEKRERYAKMLLGDE